MEYVEEVWLEGEEIICKTTILRSSAKEVFNRSKNNILSFILHKMEEKEVIETKQVTNEVNTKLEDAYTNVLVA